jgi:hypothetical protein
MSRYGWLYICMLIVFSTTSVQVQAQTIKAFTPDSVIFLDELNTFLENVSPSYKQDVRKLMARLEFEWNYGNFKDFYRRRVYETANRMLAEQLKPYPDFFNYLKSVMHFYDTRQPLSAYNDLHDSYLKLLEPTSKKPYLGYLERINDLFENQYLYNYKGVIWRYTGGEFDFYYDTVPKFIFRNINLTCLASRDSIGILNTAGTYFPTLNVWVGHSGRVTWERAGYSPEIVHAALSDYTIRLQYSNYSADSVIFYHTGYFDRPLPGRLEDKVMANTTSENAIYPVFDSYLKRIQIKDLFKNMEFDGGFRLEGKQVQGSGSPERNATLTIFNKGKEFIVLGSQNFSIESDRIASQKATVTIYHESDSIYHPGLQMRYLDEKKELTLIRGNDGLSFSPYYDSYHEVDMYFESLNWKLDQPSIELERMKGLNPKGQATFESNNFYLEYRFDRLMGIDPVHPLIAIKNLVRNDPEKSFYVDELAEFLQKSDDQVRATVIQLTNLGFLNYDPTTDKAVVKERLYHYIDAKNGKTDYDVIRFNSEVEDQSNATLDINTFDLRIKGVQLVTLSDSQNVFIHPRNNELLLRQNRNFVFSGRVEAGLLDFYAKNCTFNYDTFKLNMPVIDSLSLKVISHKPNKEGKIEPVRLNSVIRNLNGTLWIDFPTNKSGLEPFPRYPYFTSKEDSYVYYNDPRIEKGVYTDSLFYYQVYPFTFDSLNQFTTEGISFQGKLVSAGILPDIEQALTVQPDLSLGFTKKAPQEGYPVFDDKGQFYNDIQLSNKGLKGDGTLTYLTSTAVSNRFSFYPDSVNALVSSFTIRESADSVEYPEVYADSGYYHWLPGRDSLFVSSLRGYPLAMFGNQSNMMGTLVLTPELLTGHGTVYVEDGEIESTNITFSQNVFDAERSNFRIRTHDKTDLALSTFGYSAFVDMTNRNGEFHSTGGNSKVNLPANRYVCFMDKFEWSMDGDSILLSNTLSVDTARINKMSYTELIDADLSGSEFISTHPDQDSLEFFSLTAVYDLKENVLYAEDVKLIKVADAAVFPGDGKVLIRQDALMEPLVNAVIIADTARKSHLIYDATVSITSRNHYKASGKYDYTDELGGVQQIAFNNISTDKEFRTYAIAQIPDSVNFMLSPYFDFRGNILLATSREFLTFDGGFRIRQDCDPIPPSWVRFTAEVNPGNVFLPVPDTLYDMVNKRIFDAVVMSAGYDIYPAFFGRKERMDETEIMSASGYIHYHKPSQAFIITSAERFTGKSQTDNYISLGLKNCVISGKGKVDPGVNYGEVTIQAYGNSAYYMIPDSAVFNLYLNVDFYFADELLRMLIDKLVLSNLPGIDITKESYKNAVTSMMGQEAADNLITELSLYGTLRRLPAGLQHSMVFGDLGLKWNDRTRSYISSGPIGISSIRDRSINKYANGTIELAKRRTGDELNIYIETAEKEWFYFNYSNHIMQSISSVEEYNATLSNMKEDKRILDLPDTKENYQFIISTRQKMMEFVRKIQSL